MRFTDRSLFRQISDIKRHNVRKNTLYDGLFKYYFFMKIVQHIFSPVRAVRKDREPPKSSRPSLPMQPSPFASVNVASDQSLFFQTFVYFLSNFSLRSVFERRYFAARHRLSAPSFVIRSHFFRLFLPELLHIEALQRL